MIAKGPIRKTSQFFNMNNNQSFCHLNSYTAAEKIKSPLQSYYLVSFCELLQNKNT